MRELTHLVRKIVQLQVYRCRHMRLNRCCLFLFLSALIFAEQAGDRSGIDGFVTGDMAAAVASATVGIDSRTGNFHRQTTTNTSGYYLMDDLQPGGYSVWAEVKPYGCIIYPHVPLLPGERTHQNFHFVRAKRYPGNCEPVQKREK